MKRAKIYYNIEESNFKFTYNNLTFYFSSQFYLNKFKNEYINFIKTETMKLRIKYQSIIEADEIILNLLYKKIEKRGYRVYYFEDRITENSIFNIDLLKY